MADMWPNIMISRKIGFQARIFLFRVNKYVNFRKSMKKTSPFCARISSLSDINLVFAPTKRDERCDVCVCVVLFVLDVWR